MHFNERIEQNALAVSMPVCLFHFTATFVDRKINGLSYTNFIIIIVIKIVQSVVKCCL